MAVPDIVLQAHLLKHSEEKFISLRISADATFGDVAQYIANSENTSLNRIYFFINGKLLTFKDNNSNFSKLIEDFQPSPVINITVFPRKLLNELPEGGSFFKACEMLETYCEKSENQTPSVSFLLLKQCKDKLYALLEEARMPIQWVPKKRALSDASQAFSLPLESFIVLHKNLSAKLTQILQEFADINNLLPGFRNNLETAKSYIEYLIGKLPLANTRLFVTHQLYSIAGAMGATIYPIIQGLDPLPTREVSDMPGTCAGRISLHRKQIQNSIEYRLPLGSTELSVLQTENMALAINATLIAYFPAVFGLEERFSGVTPRMMTYDAQQKTASEVQRLYNVVHSFFYPPQKSISEVVAGILLEADINNYYEISFDVGYGISSVGHVVGFRKLVTGGIEFFDSNHAIFVFKKPEHFVKFFKPFMILYQYYLEPNPKLNKFNPSICIYKLPIAGDCAVPQIDKSSVVDVVAHFANLLDCFMNLPKRENVFQFQNPEKTALEILEETIEQCQTREEVQHLRELLDHPKYAAFLFQKSTEKLHLCVEELLRAKLESVNEVSTAETSVSVPY